MKKYGFQVVKSLDFWIFVTETVTSDEVRLWPEELPSKFFPLTFSYKKTLPKLNVYFLYQQPAHHEMLFSSIGKSEIANIWGRSKLPSSQFLFSNFNGWAHTDLNFSPKEIIITSSNGKKLKVKMGSSVERGTIFHNWRISLGSFYGCIQIFLAWEYTF